MFGMKRGSGRNLGKLAAELPRSGCAGQFAILELRELLEQIFPSAGEVDEFDHALFGEENELLCRHLVDRRPDGHQNRRVRAGLPDRVESREILLALEEDDDGLGRGHGDPTGAELLLREEDVIFSLEKKVDHGLRGGAGNCKEHLTSFIEVSPRRTTFCIH